MRTLALPFLVLLLAGSSRPLAAEDGRATLPAFPGAEGFGAATPGGRGGRVLEVTTLAADGPGSLRQALATKGPRTVVFRVGGVIQLERDLEIAEPFVTVAGQTAPGDGICLRGGGLRIGTHDVVIRYLRVRVGDAPAGPNPENRDGIGIAHRTIAPHHIVLDHCSVSWAIDENVQLWYPCHDITIQHCLISESLERSRHPKGAHGMGLLVGDHARRVSVHHNVFAHNMDRNPLLKGDTVTEVLNNVVYNWRHHGAALTDPEGSGPQLADIRGNVFLPGPQSPARAGITLQASVKAGTAVHLRDNLGPGRTADTDDEWSAALARTAVATRAPAPVVAGERVQLEPAAGLVARLLEAAGAVRPVRDAVDARVIQSIRDRTGRLVDSPAEVGGWPDYRGGEPPADADHDGMPDAWERQHALDPASPADALQRAPTGYTWLEEYLNERAR